METTLYRVRTGADGLSGQQGIFYASEMTDTYAVVNFPRQSDQTRRWYNPVSPSGRWSQYDTITDGGLSGIRRAIGKYNGVWIFGFVTPLQTQYIRSRIFPTDGMNEYVTIVTWDDNQGWICLNITAHWNEPARTAQAFPGVKGQLELRVDFDEGSIANSGGAYDASAYDSGYDIGGIPA